MGWLAVGGERDQTTLFPPCLEDWIAEDNPVYVVDAFVDALELGALGFAGGDAARILTTRTQRGDSSQMFLLVNLKYKQLSGPPDSLPLAHPPTSRR